MVVGATLAEQEGFLALHRDRRVFHEELLVNLGCKCCPKLRELLLLGRYLTFLVLVITEFTRVIPLMLQDGVILSLTLNLMASQGALAGRLVLQRGHRVVWLLSDCADDDAGWAVKSPSSWTI